MIGQSKGKKAKPVKFYKSEQAPKSTNIPAFYSVPNYHHAIIHI